ncbi:DMT family transporter [Billgrantia endophytica]|uniref:EamA family transporter n=1 Tax=Billgrantia endophytica TaxID=2033802 RepID=A0A2N7U4G1_9GAMM|nr:DMT family transporter [Halomonas endophytica]PMR75313.1 EamA family transporter [Halomonas endophytica]
MNKYRALSLLVLVAFCWGLNWPVGKLLLQDIPPLWIVFLRSAVGTVALLVVCFACRRLVVPKREDLPVVLSVGLLHMTAFSAFVSLGLQYVTAGRSVVLAYTTPIWVIPAAYLLLGERLSRPRAVGSFLGLVGLLVLFNPGDFSWADIDSIYGNGLILIAALFWAASILYIRIHKWVTPPFELTFWQALVATFVLFPIAVYFEGVPSITFNLRVVLLLLYGGVFGIAVAYWAMTTVNRAIPSAATSVGLLLVPIFGIACSWILLYETPDLALIISAVLIISGALLGILSRGSDKNTSDSTSLESRPEPKD